MANLSTSFVNGHSIISFSEFFLTICAGTSQVFFFFMSLKMMKIKDKVAHMYTNWVHPKSIFRAN